MTTIDIAGFAAVISLNLLLLCWTFSRWSKLKPRLRAWALNRDLRVLSMRMCLPLDLFSIPFWPMTKGWTWNYTRFTVRDGEGKTRQGWAYVNAETVLIIWDDG